MRRKDLLTGTIAGAAAAALSGRVGASGTTPYRGKPLTLPASKRIRGCLSNLSRRNADRLRRPLGSLWRGHGRVSGHHDERPDAFRPISCREIDGPSRVRKRAAGRSRICVRIGAAARRSGRWRSTELCRADGVGSAGQPRSTRTASVCTGAFRVAEAGLFDGLPATTHHAFYDDFAKAFPQVQVVRDVRFVENPLVSSAGGLTSGIDLALRIVERYFGLQTATSTANYLEYKRSAIATRWPQPAAM